MDRCVQLADYEENDKAHTLLMLRKEFTSASRSFILLAAANWRREEKNPYRTNVSMDYEPGHSRFPRNDKHCVFACSPGCMGASGGERVGEVLLVCADASDELLGLHSQHFLLCRWWDERVCSRAHGCTHYPGPYPMYGYGCTYGRAGRHMARVDASV